MTQDKARNQNAQAQNKEQHKEQRKENKRPNFIVYNARIAWRFYSKLAQEAILSLLLIAPLYLYARWMGIDEVTIPATLPVMWGIAFVLFILQSFMFNKGG